MDRDKAILTAREAAVAAGEYILENMGNIKEMSFKSGVNDPVTDVDKASERIITEKILSVFPSHSLLAEEGGETGDDDNEFIWVIDPLDGTVNYAHSFPFFCVSIALKRDKDVILGVVYDPLRKEMFHAEKSKGAYLNGVKINVSESTDVARSLIATGFAYSSSAKSVNIDLFKKMVSSARGIRRPGAAALDLCYVAAARLDGFWELDLSPWDTAAGYLLVVEAGGKVSTIDGDKYDIFKKSILASNGKIHDEMSSILLA